MSRNTKIILTIVVILLLLCLCGCGLIFFIFQSLGTMLEQSMVTDPAGVANISESIADYELPAGYQEAFGMNLFGFSIVALVKGDLQGDADNLIMLMQIPAYMNMSEADMEQQLRQALERQTNTGDMQLTVVDQTTVTIRDQQVVLTISEGTDNEGEQIRQAMGLFQGKGGPTMLMIIGPTQSWDQAAIDQFLESIR
jgi:hypothetical protein